MKKKEFTSFDVAAVVRELKESILDSRVNNIYQTDNKTLLFKLHKPDKPAFLLILEAGKRLHLTSYEVEKAAVPPGFCMALRKYLRNSSLTDIEQYAFERVVVFYFQAKTEKLKLVLELFGEGNIILASEQNMILQALTYKRMRDRNILRDEPFSFAPPSGKNPLKANKEELREELKSFGDVEVVRAIARSLSIGGTYAEEILLRTGIDKKKSCNTLSDSDVDAILNCLQALLSQVMHGKLEPSIVSEKDDGFVDVVPFKLRIYEESKYQACNSFNEALDEFYTRVITVEKATAGVKVEELKRETERLKRIIESQEKTLPETEAKAEKDRQIGNTIYAHVGELQVLLDRFLTSKKDDRNWKDVAAELLDEKKESLKPSLFFESFDAKGMIVYVCVDELKFGLGLHKKLFEEAGDFYERSKRARQKLEGAKIALEETRRELAKAENKIREVEALEQLKPTETIEKLAKRKIERKEWFEKFRWFHSSDGFLVVAGKDAVSNEVLIKKYTAPDDIVFHADVTGAPFVVIKTEDKKSSEQTLREAGEFAAAFCRGWREGFGTADVYWVTPNQLSKTAPSGEYVPHGAFIVSGKRNWLRNTPLRTAIGIMIREDDRIDFVGGPADMVKTKTKAHLIIVPGDYEGKELLKHVLKVLAEKMPKELREKVLKASIEEIREYIPYTKGRISDKQH